MTIVETLVTEQYKGYTINVYPDYNAESPAEWGNYEIVTFNCDLITDGNEADYFTESGMILPAIQAKMRAGKLWPFEYRSHGPQSAYRLWPDPTTKRGIDGFIIFTDEYAKNFSDYDGRYRMAQQDLETYTEWANGGCYGFDITNKYGESFDGSNMWGFYGLDDVIEQAHATIDWDIAQDRPQHHAIAASKVHN
jgi:hypothetical protein